MEAALERSTGPERCGELLSLALVSLSPWVFGAVEAWAVLALELGIGALALLATFAAWRAGRRLRVFTAPSLALLGLIALARFQSTPLPDGWLRTVAPATATTRAALAPGTPVRVIDEESNPVAPPAPVLSVDRDESLRAAARLTAAWVLYQAVLALGGGHGALRRYGIVLAVNAALLSLFALVQALAWNGKIYWVRPSPIVVAWNTGGPFVGHSPLAAELNLGLGFALAFLLTPGRGRFQPWTAYVASVIAVGIVASHSRTGFLAMIAALGVTAAQYRAGRLRSGRGMALGLTTTLLIIPLMLVAMGQTSPLSRIGTIADKASYSPRLEIWKSALSAWRDRPFWGAGLGTFATAAAPYVRNDDGAVYTRAENEYLDLLAEGGIVAAALAGVLLIGMARDARAALRKAESPRDRLLVLGAIFGLVSLAVHSLGDFATHIPAVAVAAIVLAARLVGLGIDGEPASACLPQRRAAWALAGGAMLALMVVMVSQGVSLARAERALAGAGLPLPGSAQPEPSAGDAPVPGLEPRRAALAAAVALRPDWAEGYVRLGLTELALYRATATQWLSSAGGPDGQATVLASPLWLHGLVHGMGTEGVSPTWDGEAPAERRTPARQAPQEPRPPENPPSRTDLRGSQQLELRQVLDQEPVRRYLIPATHAFLEARRCAPTLALPHAELAQLDYLVAGGEPVAVHAARALRLGRASAGTLILAGEAALQAGDVALGCRCLNAALAARPATAAAVAEAVGPALPSELILEQVLTPGPGAHLVDFADRLYGEPEDVAVRNRFLRVALKRLPADAWPGRAERLRLEAVAAAALDDRALARRRMEEALRLEPDQSTWRAQLIIWLIDWGEPAEARRQAMLGKHLDPSNWRFNQALEAAAEALAQGGSTD
jgi:O-antigen ligase